MDRGLREDEEGMDKGNGRGKEDGSQHTEMDLRVDG